MTPFPCSKYFVIFALSVASGASSSDCLHDLYTGFDSRVKARLIGRLAPGREPVVGFDVVHGVAVVALPHRLVLFRNRRVNLFVEEEVRGLISDVKGNLFLRVKDPSEPEHEVVKRLGAAGLQRDSTLTTEVRGTLYGSGTKLFVETIPGEGQTTFLARRQDGAYAVITNVRGELRTLSWNRTGLAAVVSNTALVWPTDSKKLIALATDQGLNHARDICLVGSDRAVVTLSDSALVLTPNGVTVLVGMHGRCAWDGSSLYLLDERSGLIWSVRGVEKLGTRTGDLAHAEELAESLPADAANNSPAALEAARIAGCSEVMRMRNAHANAKTSPAPAGRAAPETVAALLELAKRQMDQGDYAAAIDSFNLVLKRANNSNAARVGLKRAGQAMLAEREIIGIRSGAATPADQSSTGRQSVAGTLDPQGKVGGTSTLAQIPDQHYWYCYAETSWKWGTNGASDEYSIGLHFYSTVFSGAKMSNEAQTGYMNDWKSYLESSEPGTTGFGGQLMCTTIWIFARTGNHAPSSEEAEAARQNLMEDDRKKNEDYYAKTGRHGRTDIRSLPYQPQSSPESTNGGKIQEPNAEPPAPSSPSPVNGPTLDSTLRFVQDKMTSQGPLYSTAYLTNDRGQTRQFQEVFEITYFKADASACHIAYNLTNPNAADTEFSFDLRDVDTVKAMTVGQNWQDVASKSGHPNMTKTTDPPEFVVDIILANSSQDFLFYFADQDVANKVAAALIHAVELCGGQK